MMAAISGSVSAKDLCMSLRGGQLIGVEFELKIEDSRPCGTLAMRRNPYHP